MRKITKVSFLKRKITRLCAKFLVFFSIFIYLFFRLKKLFDKMKYKSVRFFNLVFKIYEFLKIMKFSEF